MNLTREQKIKLNMGRDDWSNYDLDGKIYAFNMSDGPMGIRRQTQNNQIEPAIAYPSMQMLSHTWDLELVGKYADALADDCIDHNVDILLGPGVNIKRSPLCGRNFEYVSEDPILAGLVGYYYISGLQRRHIGACLKHYCCNNQEYERYWISAEVDEKTLRELYLMPFEIASKAKPWTVMTSYNRVNGTQVNEDKRLHIILREEFDFDGAVISDWGAVHRPSQALNAGTNLIMPYDEGRYQKLLSATDIDEMALNENAQHVINLADKCKSQRMGRQSKLTIEQRYDIAQEVAEGGIVLLKNNGVLPIRDKSMNLPIMGNAAEHYYRGGGSSEVKPDSSYVKLHEALQKHGAEGAHFAWNEETGTLRNCTLESKTAPAVIVAVGNPHTVESEEFDRQVIRLSSEEEFYINTLTKINSNVIVIIYAGSAIDMSEWIDKVAAVIWAGYGGVRSNDALARILLGEVNPSGKLTETFPLSLEDIPSYHAPRNAESVVYEEKSNIGYRYFASENIPVLFPFGFGLSYSQFDYARLNIVDCVEYYEVSLDINNLSDVDGYEIVQLYVGPKDRRLRELKGFTKVFVGAHSKENATIIIDKVYLKNYDINLNQWVPYSGLYEFCVGKNCVEFLLRQDIVL